MSEAAEDIASSRVARVKSGEPKTAVYGYADPDAHDMVKLGHAEGSHYIDLCILADSYPTLRARIAELERDAERWRECVRLAEARGITSHEWSMMFRVDTGTLEGNIDASIASRRSVGSEYARNRISGRVYFDHFRDLCWPLWREGSWSTTDAARSRQARCRDVGGPRRRQHNVQVEGGGVKSTIRSGRYPCPKCSKKGVGYASHAHASGWKDYSKAVCRYCKSRFNIKAKLITETQT